ncbi:MAG: gliding motility-associated C-terminal domain-containing protein [Bacteroidetes bacterium]|nr:gliding motility-associated C-terminal domain-containing protein [Bacteroidota bacterium]
MKQLFWILSISFFFASCKKEEILAPCTVPDTAVFTVTGGDFVCIFPYKAVVVNISTQGSDAQILWHQNSQIVDSGNSKVFEYNSYIPSYNDYTIAIHGATYSDSFNISVRRCEPSLFVPNSFSPNGDGINETWQPAGTEIKEIYFEIRDLKGKHLYSSVDIKKGWNGRINDRYTQLGTYFYFIKWRYDDCSEHERSGKLLLQL